jgi:ankyrin repeat protein
VTRRELEEIWSETLRSTRPPRGQFDRLAEGIVELYSSGDFRFRQHIQNRFNRVTNRTGQSFDPKNFDLASARAFIADEIGFYSWGELTDYIENQSDDSRPILFLYAIAAMDMGNFSALESTVGGPEAFGDQIIEWFEKDYFTNEPETLAEVFAAACMLGHERTAAYLLDKGVDPYAGMKTGLAGFHYAASSGRLNVIKLLIERKAAMEVRNMYGGTVFGQAMWSAINEYTPDHAEIIERLIEAGAVIEPGTLEWWEKQNVPSAETKQRVADALRRRTI